jgi:GTP-binding protein EngB required for normal cell division
MKAAGEAEVPSFAVVGRVNMGKSAVIATLLEIDDNELVRVSATPGETTRCQVHPVVFDGR